MSVVERLTDLRDELDAVCGSPEFVDEVLAAVNFDELAAIVRDVATDAVVYDRGEQCYFCKLCGDAADTAEQLDVDHRCGVGAARRWRSENQQ